MLQRQEYEPAPGRRQLPNEADLFAVYSPYTKQVHVLAVDEVGNLSVWLRLTPAKNNQHLKVRVAEEHTLAAWAARITPSKAQQA